MNPVKALIVEDNAFMARILYDMLKRYANSIIVSGIAKTGKAAISRIKSVKPDVVFLDIELPDMTGFELLQQLKRINFQTVFTTSHSHYAIKAFRFNALDYLVKPVNENELDEAIKRLLRSATNTTGVRNALFNLEVQSLEDQKLVLPQQNGTLRLPLKQITHIESERNYSYIHLLNGNRELSSKNLAYFDDVLIEKDFYRSHRSYLVNRFHIKVLTDGNFVLKNGIEIPISRRKQTEAKAWFLGLE
jgi:two-component system LytT family response regulator